MRWPIYLSFTSTKHDPQRYSLSGFSGHRAANGSPRGVRAIRCFGGIAVCKAGNSRLWANRDKYDRLSVATEYIRRGDYIKQMAPSLSDGWNENRGGIRTKIKFMPSSGVTVTLAADYGQSSEYLNAFALRRRGAPWSDRFLRRP